LAGPALLPRSGTLARFLSAIWSLLGNSGLLVLNVSSSHFDPKNQGRTPPPAAPFDLQVADLNLAVAQFEH
jgi:hypothetical protein